MNIYRKENTFSLSYYVHTYHRKPKLKFNEGMLAYIWENSITLNSGTYRQTRPLEKVIKEILKQHDLQLF